GRGNHQAVGCRARALRRQRPAGPGAGRRRPGRAGGLRRRRAALDAAAARRGQEAGRGGLSARFRAARGQPVATATPAGAAMSEVNVLWQRATGIARQPAFMQGVRDMLGTMPGIAAWGLVTGVAMVKSGMSL